MSIAALKSFLKFLADIEIVPVVFAIGISIIWPHFLLAALIVAAFFWPIRRLALGYFSTPTPADWGTILLVFMLPVTLWTTALPDITQLQVIRLLTGTALFYAIVNWCISQQRLRLLLPAFTLVGLGLGLLALVSVQWAADKLPFGPSGIYRAVPALFSDTVHPNVLAGSLVIFIPIVLAELLFAWSGLSAFEKTLNLLTLPLMLAVLGLTLSRGAWIAMATVLVAMPILRWRWGWIVIVMALAVHGLTDAVTWGMVRPAVFVWAIWGLALAGWMVLAQSRNQSIN